MCVNNANLYACLEHFLNECMALDGRKFTVNARKN